MKHKAPPKHKKPKAVVVSQIDPDWPKTVALIRQQNDPATNKLLTWFYATQTSLTVDPKQLKAFIDANPGWPRLHVFRAKIEKNISAWNDPAAVAAWFDKNPPESFDGIRGDLDALLRLGQPAKAKTALLAFWQDAELNKNQTAALAGAYKAFFTPADHAARLDNLLWDDRYAEAEAMLPFVDGNARALGTARIALGHMDKNADGLVAAVPSGLQRNEGLVFDRTRLRRRRNNDPGAMEMLAFMPAKSAHPEKWWGELNILARRRMEADDFAGAYKIVKRHSLTDGIEYAQAEWLVGWLALRQLQDPVEAYRHFDALYRNVGTAISLSRGAYWAARAAEQLPNHALAQQWDKVAAQYPSTYYGQLSYEHVYGKPAPGAFRDAPPSPAAKQAFDAKELVHVVRLLKALKLKDMIDPFLARLNADAKTRDDYALVAALARETERYYYAVQANKDCQQDLGQFLFTEGYPVLPPLPRALPEKSLVHAIIHRESMFNPMATSSVGARGLMQLMPNTAKVMAKHVGANFDMAKLTADPRYNVSLGSAYLENLVEDYGGFYPMAIAAYNAGPGNVREWIETFGDPRQVNNQGGRIDIVDWVEEIPIYETRNYVQRVMESYYMYRLRFGQPPRSILDFMPPGAPRLASPSKPAAAGVIVVPPAPVSGVSSTAAAPVTAAPVPIAPAVIVATPASPPATAVPPNAIISRPPLTKTIDPPR